MFTYVRVCTSAAVKGGQVDVLTKTPRTVVRSCMVVIWVNLRREMESHDGLRNPTGKFENGHTHTYVEVH